MQQCHTNRESKKVKNEFMQTNQKNGTQIYHHAPGKGQIIKLLKHQLDTMEKSTAITSKPLFFRHFKTGIGLLTQRRKYTIKA